MQVEDHGDYSVPQGAVNSSCIVGIQGLNEYFCSSWLKYDNRRLHDPGEQDRPSDFSLRSLRNRRGAA
jgi:hypothetical protein